MSTLQVTEVVSVANANNINNTTTTAVGSKHQSTLVAAKTPFSIEDILCQNLNNNNNSAITNQNYSKSVPSNAKISTFKTERSSHHKHSLDNEKSSKQNAYQQERQTEHSSNVRGRNDVDYQRIIQNHR